MDTRLQVLLYVNNIATRTLGQPTTKFGLFERTLTKKLPWLLLPDAISHLVTYGERASHFEVSPNNCGISWIEYPSATILRTLSPKNFRTNIKYFISSMAYPNFPIGEPIQLGKFDIRNWQHQHCGAIRCHLIQENCRNKHLRTLIDDSNRANHDFNCLIRHNNQTISSTELRHQINIYEKFCFLKVVEKLYQQTGILTDREWFAKHVYGTLTNTYPAELANTTYACMTIPEELNTRIQKKDFVLTDKEKTSILITDDVEKSFETFFNNVLFESFNDF